MSTTIAPLSERSRRVQAFLSDPSWNIDWSMGGTCGAYCALLGVALAHVRGEVYQLRFDRLEQQAKFFADRNADAFAIVASANKHGVTLADIEGY